MMIRRAWSRPPCAATTGTAQAQSRTDCRYTTGPSWTGFYVGGDFGAGGTLRRANANPGNGAATLNVDGLGGGGVLGSVHGGVDYQVLPQGRRRRAGRSDAGRSYRLVVGPGAGRQRRDNSNADLGCRVPRARRRAGHALDAALSSAATPARTSTPTARPWPAAPSPASRATIRARLDHRRGFETMLTRRLVDQARVPLQPVRDEDGPGDQASTIHALHAHGPARPFLPVRRPPRRPTTSEPGLSAGEDATGPASTAASPAAAGVAVNRLSPRVRRRLRQPSTRRGPGPARLGLRRRRLPVRAQVLSALWATSPGPACSRCEPGGRRRHRRRSTSHPNRAGACGPRRLPADAVDTALRGGRLYRPERHPTATAYARRRPRSSRSEDNGFQRLDGRAGHRDGVTGGWTTRLEYRYSQFEQQHGAEWRRPAAVDPHDPRRPCLQVRIGAPSTSVASE